MGGLADGALEDDVDDVGGAGAAPDRAILLLPILAAFAYACMQILTRRLAVASKASAMAVYLQGTFIVVSLLFWAVAGAGRFVRQRCWCRPGHPGRPCAGRPRPDEAQDP